MITLLFRFLALFLIISALMLLGADAIGTLESGGVVKLRSLADVLALFAPGAAPDPSGPLGAAFSAPGWAVFGIVGLVLAFFFRHRDEEFES